MRLVDSDEWVPDLKGWFGDEDSRLQTGPGGGGNILSFADFLMGRSKFQGSETPSEHE